jgi:LacI family transcriptional regulator
MAKARSRISIQDVAERAGVSTCTVSKVLNGKTARITDSTREHVRQVARELGYEPNRFARLLGKNDTRMVGVLIHNLSNPVYGQAVEILEEILHEQGYQALFEVPGIASVEDIKRQGSKLRGWPVDAFLFWCSEEFDLSFFHGSAAQEVPCLYVETARADGKPYVMVDLYSGGVLAARHLLERGYTDIAHVALAYHEFPDERTRGFCETMREAGQPVELIPVAWNEQNRENGLRIGGEIAARPPHRRPRAIFCHNDLLAIGVHRGLQRGGLRIPEDVAVIGFDGIEEGEYLEKPLTTVAWSVEEMCRVSVARLLQAIAGEETAGTASAGTLIPMGLQLGGTT